MSSYIVTTPFQAFDREYKPGAVLTDADMACWLPEEDRAVVVDGLVQFGKLVPLSADAPAAGYPATWGSTAPAEPAPEPPPPEPEPDPEPTA
jgi:hypothetical protein